MEKTPRAGEIFYLTKDKPYQIITFGIHKETCESMVIYQALFGDYSTFVLPLSKFMEELYTISSKEHADAVKIQRLENASDEHPVNEQTNEKNNDTSFTAKMAVTDSDDKVNEILLRFLDAGSYTEKLEIITTNIKAIDDRLINDMAASLDCIVEDGPVEQRLQELIYCLKQLSRFEVRGR